MSFNFFNFINFINFRKLNYLVTLLPCKNTCSMMGVV